MSALLGLVLAREPPPRRLGALVGLCAVALCTAIVYPLKLLAPVTSLTVVYLPAVLLVSLTWGAWLGIGTGALAAFAFNFFHLPPIGQLAISHSSDWVALTVFAVVAVLSSSVAAVVRARALDAEARRVEADLAADLARVLLRGGALREGLPTAAARIAQTLQLNSAAIHLQAKEADARTIAFELHEGGRALGTLLVGVDSPQASLRRLEERVVPALEDILSAALEREALLGEVVETAALRRADTVKTALLRAVSHDLRSPLTAISAAGESVASPSVSQVERDELAAVIQEETRRLSRLVENLLDLSRLQAGGAEPREEWASIEELIRSALRELSAGPEEFLLSIDRDLPLVRLDAVQMERALVNVLENARRHSGGHPVSIRARAVRSLAHRPERGDPSPNGSSHTGIVRQLGERLIVRVVDRGPGIPAAQLERVFEPFYRAGTHGAAHRGSGLGLAIARGFTEANAGTLHVESLPGQGATFVFQLPLREALETVAAAEARSAPTAEGLVGAAAPARGGGQA